MDVLTREQHNRSYDAPVTVQDSVVNVDEEGRTYIQIRQAVNIINKIMNLNLILFNVCIYLF